MLILVDAEEEAKMMTLGAEWRFVICEYQLCFGFQTKLVQIVNFFYSARSSRCCWQLLWCSLYFGHHACVILHWLHFIKKFFHLTMKKLTCGHSHGDMWTAVSTSLCMLQLPGEHLIPQSCNLWEIRRRIILLNLNLSLSKRKTSNPSWPAITQANNFKKRT